jgi:glucosamine--fructose-6-phosphate aminotransferase (isomerizing)
MCGIFGYVGHRDDAAQVVLRGLKCLEYRGYDSWGIAVSHEARACVDRRVGRIGSAETSLPASRIGLGHTRWATHGVVNTENAHPQLDCKERLALVHNGMVANEQELRDALGRAGHRLRSHTDTELIAHVIEDALERIESHEPKASRPPGEALLRATIAAFRKLRGLNAIAVLDTRSGSLVAAKSGSPLMIGFADGAHLLASDHVALLPHTRRVCFVRDGQAVLLTAARARLFEIASEAEELPETAELEAAPVASERADHPDFMTKEIHEQPALLAGYAERSWPAVQQLTATIDASEDVYLVGCGSAYHAALAGQYLLAAAGRRATAVSASEFPYLRPLLGRRSLIIALSQSGETIDTLEAVRTARECGACTVGVTNLPGSSLWRLCEQSIPLEVGPERCVLATKSLTAKLALLLLTAATLKGRLAEVSAALSGAATDLAGLLSGERRDEIRAIAQAIHTQQHLYVIGRGINYPLALESALKIKEVSYVHSEGFAGGELKHGVMALIEPGTPCLVLVPNDETEVDVLNAALQVKARGALVIGVSARPHPVFDHRIALADCAEAAAVSYAVPAQLLGSDLARLRGHDPDMPRNLAKSVTVK